MATLRQLALSGRISEARRALSDLKHGDGLELSPTDSQALDHWEWVLSPLWWLELKHGRIFLRRASSIDRAFFERCQYDQQFVKRFNRRWASGFDLQRLLWQSENLPPLHVGVMYWTVVVDGIPRGISSLAGIDQLNRHAEFSIGFPDKPDAGIALKTSLMVIHFALWMLGLHKLIAYIYEDNESAKRNAQHLGFQIEGILGDHFFFNNEPTSVAVFGLTRNQVLANPSLTRIARRTISQRWIEESSPAFGKCSFQYLDPPAITSIPIANSSRAREHMT